MRIRYRCRFCPKRSQHQASIDQHERRKHPRLRLTPNTFFGQLDQLDEILKVANRTPKPPRPDRAEMTRQHLRTYLRAEAARECKQKFGVGQFSSNVTRRIRRRMTMKRVAVQFREYKQGVSPSLGR